MELLFNLPAAGSIVIAVIALLFILAVILLFWVYFRYRRLTRLVDLTDPEPQNDLTYRLKEDFAAAYRRYGRNTNTPAIITNAVTSRMGGALLSERFMNSAVSSFVTLGLFGTFLGLSLSVSSLTELISLSSSEEWLGILDSVGGGLVSALSGMGVAFYTSLAGVICAILFTFFRTVFNPQAQREKLETLLELWLDHGVAPTLETDAPEDDNGRLMQLKEELRLHARTVQQSLTACTGQMEQTLHDTTDALGRMIQYSKEPIQAFYDTVSTFNDNVRDFSEFNYDLRGNIERMDLCFRELTSELRKTSRNLSGGDRT